MSLTDSSSSDGTVRDGLGTDDEPVDVDAMSDAPVPVAWLEEDEEIDLAD